MINLTVEEIIRLHEKLICRTGGMRGIKDAGLLESAVYGAMQAYDEIEAYPTPAERAARLAFALTMNHPFADGNKRTGILVMLMTLRANGVAIAYTQHELIKLGYGIADGTKGYPDILKWIYGHTV